MNYRILGKTGLRVSEIGFGGEWLDRHTPEEGVALIRHANKRGINILDCWMSDPKVRSIIGEGIKGCREQWYIQGHIGSTWQNGQYVRTRDMAVVKPAFEDLLQRLGTDYIDLGMIHYVDEEKEWQSIQDSDFLRYVFELKEKGIIKHIGMSTHNPLMAKHAAECGFIEMILFSVNPAFDMLPPSEDINTLFAGEFDEALSGIAPERAELYRLCERNNVGITVMKGFAGGRLFDAARSPFGVALTPVQCLHYCLTRPAVASVMCGVDTIEQIDEAVSYHTASDEQKDYASVLASAPRHACSGQCTYCGHCKPCPAFIDIAMVNKLYDLAVMQEQIPDSIRAHYMSLEHHADECIGCKGCESRCPFGVKIAERMEQTAKLFTE
ncbi:MAG: aldo/keto reductase [Ruminococcaceae bacterium]|nr:aldo/keto reductase [Oscillospiraceae bacterium]